MGEGQEIVVPQGLRIRPVEAVHRAGVTGSRRECPEIETARAVGVPTELRFARVSEFFTLAHPQLSRLRYTIFAVLCPKTLIPWVSCPQSRSGAGVGIFYTNCDGPSDLLPFSSGPEIARA